jgi:hypothetical protein
MAAIFEEELQCLPDPRQGSHSAATPIIVLIRRADEVVPTLCVLFSCVADTNRFQHYECLH